MIKSGLPKVEREEMLKSQERNDASNDPELQKKIYKYYSKYSKYQKQSYSWPMKVLEKGHSGTVRCCSYSPDGNYMATGSETVKIWNIKEQREELTLNGHLYDILCCSYSPDGHYLATGSKDKTIKIWNIKYQRVEFTLKGHLSDVLCCSYSSDGNHIATGSETVKIWNIKEQREELTLDGHNYDILCCSYSPDRNYLATGSETLKIWNIKERREHFTLNGHLSNILCCSYSPDGHYLATGSRDKTVKIWNIEERREYFTLKGHSHWIICCSYFPDGNYLATGSSDKTIKIWNIQEQREVFTLNENSHWVNCCCYSPDGNYLAAGFSDKTVKIWNMKEQRDEFTLNGHSILCCSYSPDENYVKTESDDKIVKIWNIKELSEVINFNPNLVENAHIKLYDWIQLYQKNESLITNIQIYSKQGLFTITSSNNGSIRVLKSVDDTEIFILYYDNSDLKGLFFMDNEKYLIAVYQKNIYKISFWNKLLYILDDNLSRCIIQREDIKFLLRDAKVAKFIYDYYNEYCQSKVKIEEQLPKIVSEFFLKLFIEKNIQMALNLSKYLVKFAKLNYKIPYLEGGTIRILTEYFSSDTQNKRFIIQGKYDLQILIFLYDSLIEFDTKQQIRISLDQIIKIRNFDIKKTEIYNPWNILEMKKFITYEELSENYLYDTVNGEQISFESFTSVYSNRKVLIKKYVLNENISKEQRKIFEKEFEKEAKCYELLDKNRKSGSFFCEYFGSIKSENSFSIVINYYGMNLHNFINELKYLKSLGEYKLREVQLAIIVKSLVESFAFLASHNILHRSISSQSLLIDEYYNIGIINFSSAAIKVDDIWYESTSDEFKDYKSPEEENKNAIIDLKNVMFIHWA